MPLDEPSAHEPSEYDPEADLPDPERDLVSVPEVETDESDVPRDLLVTFWLVVAVINVGSIIGALGLIMLAFGRDPTTSLGLVGGGAILITLAYRRYRTFRLADADDPYGTEQ